MNLKNTKQSYGIIHMLLHWLMAVLIIGNLVFGIYMTNIPFNKVFYFLHKSSGLLIFFLVCFRIIWKFLNEKPEYDPKIGTKIRIFSKLGTISLYGFTILMPLTGILMSLFNGYSVPYFGLFEISGIVAQNASYANFFKEAHEVLAFLFLMLILIHSIMGLVHHFYFKDNTLKKMLHH